MRLPKLVKTVAVVLLATILALPACAIPTESVSEDTAAAPAAAGVATTAQHLADVEAWAARRHESLTQPDGWLSLVGLMWLDDGNNSFGADPSNDLVYAAGGTPPVVGTFTVDGESARFSAAPGVEVRAVDGEGPIASIVVHEPGMSDVPVLSWGSLRWHVIRRQGRLAVRLKDAESPIRRDFAGIERFPVDGRWRVSGRFEAHDPPKPIMIPNILGTVGEGESPGSAVFLVDGVEYRLDTWKDSDDPANFFTAFADRTNGDTSYGGGRFLWIDAPDEDGQIVVDFNQSYNPPCAFTPFATCPLPPEQNRLPFAIEAGEKTYKPASAPGHR